MDDARTPAQAADWEPRFLATLTETGSIKAAAVAAGVDKSTPSRRRRDDSEFAARWDAALAAWPGPSWWVKLIEVLRETGDPAAAARAADKSKNTVQTRKRIGARWRDEYAAAKTVGEAKAEERGRAQLIETPVDQLVRLLRQDAELVKRRAAVAAEIAKITTRDRTLLRTAKARLAQPAEDGVRGGELLGLAEEWRKSQRKPASPNARARHGMVERLIRAGGFRDRTDLTTQALVTTLAEISGSHADGTRGQVTGAVKAFCRWLARRGVLEHDPADTISNPKAASTSRLRRPLSIDETPKLLEATSASQRVEHGLSGVDRAMVYSGSLFLGLRPHHLRGVTVGDFEWGDKPHVRVAPGHVAHIWPSEEAGRFRDYFRGKASPREPAFAPGFMKGRKCYVWEMLQKDLAEAGIDRGRVVKVGRRTKREGVVDVESLRLTYVARGADDRRLVPEIQQSLGHKHVVSTRRMYETFLKPEKVAELTTVPLLGRVGSDLTKRSGSTSRRHTKRRPGRPSASADVARAHRDLVAAWEQASAAGVRLKDFCGDRGITIRKYKSSAAWVRVNPA